MSFLKKIKKNRFITGIRRFIIYAVSMAACFIVKILPWKIVVKIGRALGLFAFYIVRYARKRTVDNLARVFSGVKSEREIRLIAKNVYKNICITSLEFPKMPHMTDAEFFAATDYKKEQIDYLWELLKREKGVIFASAHMGNWEMLAEFGARLGFNMSILFKPSTNPYLNKIWFGLRGNNKLIDISKDLSSVVRRLRANEVICLLFDENARNRGIMLDFFGKPASTYKGPAYFALKTGCPIVCLYFIRKKEDARHKFIIERTVWPERTGNLEQDMLHILKQMNESLEQVIRQYPEQWNWIYKRW
ncbi:MAG: lysophospholipid acyltransferase family protein [bacterium]|nr:lysophospholipid acyltransferase family protein [bacterium]